MNQDTSTSPVTGLTVKQFAATINLSERSVRRYISAGIIKAKRIGPRLIRIDASELENMGTALGPFGGR